jgi:hypothetical protein
VTLDPSVAPSTTWKRLFPLLVLAGFSSSCSDADRSAEFEALGLLVDSLSVEHGVPGVSFALFDASGLLYEHVSGVKSQATLEPIDANTAFEAATPKPSVEALLNVALVGSRGVVGRRDRLDVPVAGTA